LKARENEFQNKDVKIEQERYSAQNKAKPNKETADSLTFISSCNEIIGILKTEDPQ